MPEMRFQIQWPDGKEETCYSPSLVIKEYFAPGETYPLADFWEKSQTALKIASDRVQAKFGFPCGRAMGQLQRLEQAVKTYETLEDPQVQVLKFIE